MSVLDKKNAWARKTADGPLGIPDLYETVDLHFATQFIAERMNEGFIGIRSLKDRVRHQITEGKENGLLPSQDGRFVFGELVAWAKNKKALAPAVEGLMHISHGTFAGCSPSIQLSATGYSLPSTLDASHEALKNAYLELRALREENEALKSTVAELTPFKEKADLKKYRGRVDAQKRVRPPN
jgi:hypothetical protein